MQEFVVLLEQIEPWHWLIAGVVLGCLELFAPGVVFLWLGIAAIATGGLNALLPEMTWQGQFVIFATLSVIATIAGRKFFRGSDQESANQGLSQRGRHYEGKEYILREAIVDGVGWVPVEDTVWRIVGPDAPAGARVRVTGVEGASLVVTLAET